MTLTISRSVVDATKAFCWSKDGLPYAWGGAGRPGGDCSWFTGATAASLQGMRTDVRYGYTGTFNTPGRFGQSAAKEGAMLNLTHARSKADVPEWAVLKLGFYHSSDPGNAHTSGTVDGLNFESRGMYNGRSGHVIGAQARAWNDRLYNDWWYLDARVGAADPNAFPLPHGWYYGPLDGPEESVSGEAGEPQHQIDGIKRLQRALGVSESGRWRDMRDAVAKFQTGRPELGPPNGHVGPLTWAAIINGKGGLVTPEQYAELNRKMDEILKQLGPWEQLGKNAKGQNLTLVDAVAEMKRAATK